jgi:hypothetical protein
MIAVGILVMAIPEGLFIKFRPPLGGNHHTGLL